MSESGNPSRFIAELILSELDHFRKRFRPQGGALTFYGQIQLTNEPFVGYARVTDLSGVETKLLMCRHYVRSTFKARRQPVEFAC